MNPGLHGWDTRVERLRGFLCGALFEIVEDQRLSIFRREPFHGPPDGLRFFYASQGVVLLFAARSERVEIAEGLTGGCTQVPSIGLQCFIDRHASDPCAEARVCSERRQMKPHL
jgi:hypothetical protein